MIKRLIHKLITWYLRRVGGAFHHEMHGSGRYIAILTEEQWHWRNELVLPLLDPIRECSRSNLRGKASRFKKAGRADMWAIGEMLERACIQLDAIEVDNGLA